MMELWKKKNERERNLKKVEEIKMKIMKGERRNYKWKRQLKKEKESKSSEVRKVKKKRKRKGNDKKNSYKKLNQEWNEEREKDAGWKKKEYVESTDW